MFFKPIPTSYAIISALVICMNNTIVSQNLSQSYWPLYVNSVGLKFKNGNPVITKSGIKLKQQIYGEEAITSICNPYDGEILFYSNSSGVFNKNHQFMPNGTDLIGSNSTTQGALIIPNPGDSNLYYLFVLNSTCRTPSLSYNIINMTLDSGLGDIENGRKNIILHHNSLSEKMVGISHCNNSDYWLLVHEAYTDCFLAYRVNKDGISPPVKSCLGKVYESGNGVYPYMGTGQMKFSPDGKMLAVAHYDLGTKVYSELFDFDHSTGKISNQRKIYHGMGYGVEFSPDNSKLYFNAYPRHPGETSFYDPTLRHIYLLQYEIKNINNNKSSYCLLDSFWGPIGGLQLGIDGKIYMSSPKLYRIEKPNEPGVFCNINKNDLIPYHRFEHDTLPFYSCINLPNFFVDTRSGKTRDFDPVKDTSICYHPVLLKLDTVIFNPMINNMQVSNHLFSVSQAGKYILHGVNRCGVSITDTFNVYFNCDSFTAIGDGIFIPNVFSPNGDHVNDVFKVYGTNILQATLSVYNSWGEKLWFTDEAETNGWEGTYKDSYVIDGVYIYHLEVLTKDKSKISFRGTVTVVK